MSMLVGSFLIGFLAAAREVSWLADGIGEGLLTSIGHLERRCHGEAVLQGLGVRSEDILLEMSDENKLLTLI